MTFRWRGNIKMSITEMKWESVDWIHLAQDTDKWQVLVNMTMRLNVPYHARYFLTGCGTTSF
jgi:hypothetical protein